MVASRIDSQLSLNAKLLEQREEEGNLTGFFDELEKNNQKQNIYIFILNMLRTFIFNV